MSRQGDGDEGRCGAGHEMETAWVMINILLVLFVVGFTWVVCWFGLVMAARM